MQITRKTHNGERREALLKEYFLNASLLALLKRLGEETARVLPQRQQHAVLAKVRR